MERIAHYHILDRLGAGGMGEVYRARDTRLGRTVAIKVLPQSVAGDPERRERFLREARASAALSHPNICALFEVGEHEAQVFLVFEYVAGETLRQTIGGRPLNVRTALDTAIQLADALAEAHAAGIVHRDIKPENIVITPKGHPKILDFGLASFTDSGASRDAATEFKTAEGVALGTVAYMSPEQALGVGFDHRTDIFSLGIVLYEMLTGASPFRAATDAATAVQVVQATPPPPSALNRNVPAELDAIVLRALMKDPRRRYQTAATLAAELRSVAAILDVREEVEFEAPAERRRARWRWVAAFGLLAALVAGGAWIGRARLAQLVARWLGPPPPPVIAVLPFELIGGDGSRLYFADGLTEDLITRLGQVPGVRVLGRSATREFRGRPPKEVAGELHAAVVLTGAVQSAGDAVKVTVGLVNPGDGVQLWGQTYEKPLTSIFAVQTDIAEDVARRLSVTLAPSPARARTAARQVTAAAYDLYLRGRDAAARRDVDRAVELYRQAIQAEPALAEAHAGLAEALYLRSVYLGRGGPELIDEMRRAAVNAGDADPDLPQAQLALGLTEPGLAAALTHFRRAIELDSSYAEAYHQIGDQLMEFDPERAIRFYRRSLEIDPRATVAYVDMAFIHANAGRFADAAADYARAPREIADGAEALLELHQGRPREAVKTFESLGRGFLEMARRFKTPTPALLYVVALEQAGDRAAARTQVDALAQAVPDDCEVKAMVAAEMYGQGQGPAARAIADPLIAAARAPSAPRADVRCGPVAAAAVADADAAAAILTRIASDENHLRYWVTVINGGSGHRWFQSGWFPFDRVSGKPPVVDARTVLQKAFGREREAAAGVLAGLLEESGRASGAERR